MEPGLALLEQFSTVISQGQCIVQLDFQDSHLVIVRLSLNAGQIARGHITLIIIGQDPDPSSAARMFNLNLDLA